MKNAIYGPDSFYNGLKHKVSSINLNFRIKVSGTYNDTKYHTLVGVSGLIDLIDDIDLVNKIILKAFDSPRDKTTFKLRRGLRIDFYSK